MSVRRQSKSHVIIIYKYVIIISYKIIYMLTYIYTVYIYIYF